MARSQAFMASTGGLPESFLGNPRSLDTPIQEVRQGLPAGFGLRGINRHVQIFKVPI